MRLPRPAVWTWDSLSALEECNARAEELDTMTELKQRAAFNADDIRFSFTEAKNDTGFAATITSHNIGNDPFLATLPSPGIAASVLDIEPCGFNQLHSHPIATEYVFVIKGELKLGFFEENGGRGLISTTIKAGESFVLPQALPHFEFNPLCEASQRFAAFTATDPTATVIAPAFLGLPDEALRAMIGSEDLSGIKALKDAITVSKFRDPVCLKRCGLD
jgi:quercetin dioxygenase-like cupin family protein